MVAPLIAATEMADSRPYSMEQIPAESVVSGEEPPQTHLELEDNTEWSAADEVLAEGQELGFLRRRRSSDDVPGETMETAEQILFRPIFRHRQIVEDRLERLKAREDYRRQTQVRRPQQKLSRVDSPSPPATVGTKKPLQSRYFQNPHYEYKSTPTGVVFRPVRPKRSFYPLPYTLYL
ncbi:hypothetical protein J6590_006032 [Homalodisca vitripennis]|nr:hypothetical protein J6590_006032 [Homalodisca vitripennis]